MLSEMFGQPLFHDRLQLPDGVVDLGHARGPVAEHETAAAARAGVTGRQRHHRDPAAGCAQRDIVISCAGRQHHDDVHAGAVSADAHEGRTILVRYVWSNITPTSAHFEQAFSTDGGKTWEVNWITDQTRVE